MECPKCRKINNQVLDSRLTQEGIAVRRRRKCLACSSRFTTYEATEERLLPVLITRYTGPGNTITTSRTMLSFMATTLTILSHQIKIIVGKIEQGEKAQAALEANRKTRERMIARRKEKTLMMAERVLKIIKRHRKGIDISKLTEKTGEIGIDRKKTKKFIFELRQQGKIKNLSRGFYIVK